MELLGQSAVVTGGASGMGAACVAALRARGVCVMSWDLVQGHSEFAMVCDVRSAESVEAAIKKTVKKVGVPSICINCAGIAPAKRMVGKDGVMPLAEFKNVIDINLVGTFNVMRVVAEVMIAQGSQDATERGVFINTASIAGFEGQIGQAAYSASKGGVISMTLPLARELAQHGIRVNSIAPGLISTPLMDKMPEEVQTYLATTIPFPKRLGKPSEFASLVLHMIENSYINGEVIRLDGALRMQAK
jgi:NAD(P)-dependent dehydrogenase (short-subunit alcohol dehydrogenase family)